VQYIKIGQIINTHGHRGELKVYPLTDDLNRFLELEHVFIQTQGSEYQEYHVSKARIHQGFAIIGLAEVPDMNAALLLKGRYLELPDNELRKLPEGHYYIFQIVGLEVFDGEQVLGKIVDVQKTAANDIYVLETPRKELLYLPAIRDVVKDINLETGRMTVKIIPGLLD